MQGADGNYRHHSGVPRQEKDLQTYIRHLSDYDLRVSFFMGTRSNKCSCFLEINVA